MEDTEFLQRMKDRIQESSGRAVEVELGEQGAFELDIQRPIPKVLLGRDVLDFPGRARMLMQYTILCLRERRHVEQEEFLQFLSRN
ncbi:MAG: hypothetical protein EXR67_06070 [Dehalococcoidia bacterium]|nr:hypothetical protein [Dehalococcoidia bacterium]